MFQIRSMQPSDLPAVMAIQAACYANDVIEPESVIAARLAACPDLTWVATDEIGVCAYLFAYRSRKGHVTPLDAVFTHHPQADCLYLHDLAVAPRANSQGIGPALVHHNLGQGHAMQLRYSALVSVQESELFWIRQGYSEHMALPSEQQEHLKSYQIPAVYMLRELSV